MSTHKPLLSLYDLQSKRATAKPWQSLYDLQSKEATAKPLLSQADLQPPKKSKKPETDVNIINSFRNNKIYKALQQITRLYTKQSFKTSIRLKKSQRGKKRSTFKKAFNISEPHKQGNLLSTIINICRSTSDIKEEIHSYLNGKIPNLSKESIQLCDNLDMLTDLYKSIISKPEFDAIRNEAIYLYAGISNFDIKSGDTGFIELGLSTTINPNLTFNIPPDGTLLTIKCKLSDGIIPILKQCRNLSIKKYGVDDAFTNEEEVYLPPKTQLHVDKLIEFIPGMHLIESGNTSSLTDIKLVKYNWHSGNNKKMETMLKRIIAAEYVYNYDPSQLYNLVGKLMKKHNPRFNIYTANKPSGFVYETDMIATLIMLYCKEFFGFVPDTTQITEYITLNGETNISIDIDGLIEYMDTVVDYLRGEKLTKSLNSIDRELEYDKSPKSGISNVINKHLTTLAGEGNRFNIKICSIQSNPETDMLTTLDFLNLVRSQSLESK